MPYIFYLQLSISILHFNHDITVHFRRDRRPCLLPHHRGYLSHSRKPVIQRNISFVLSKAILPGQYSQPYISLTKFPDLFSKPVFPDIYYKAFFYTFIPRPIFPGLYSRVYNSRPIFPGLIPGAIFLNIYSKAYIPRPIFHSLYS